MDFPVNTGSVFVANAYKQFQAKQTQDVNNGLLLLSSILPSKPALSWLHV
jgi:hypothetical protein